jgi:hypothetical protein
MSWGLIDGDRDLMIVAVESRHERTLVSGRNSVDNCGSVTSVCLISLSPGHLMPGLMPLLRWSSSLLDQQGWLLVVYTVLGYFRSRKKSEP